MGAWPVMCSGKWKKSDACLSEASCASLPFSTAHHWEPRRGRAFAVAFFCLLFLATVCVKLVVAFSIRDRITESDLALCSNTHGLAIANCACPQTIVEDTYV